MIRLGEDELSVFHDLPKLCQSRSRPFPPACFNGPDMVSGQKRREVASTKRGATESPCVASSHSKNREPNADGPVPPGQNELERLLSPGRGHRRSAAVPDKICAWKPPSPRPADVKRVS